MSHRPWVALCLLLVTWACPTFADDALFPFLISYDTANNVTNVSSWLDAPAGKHGFVRTENGRLVTDKGPIRFWGTNLCFEGCFPAKEQAERLAARLARFGINCVRMHHMDSRSIWGNSPNKTIIDPEKLDRLDYLIWQLKQQGVYTNINLHVSRSLGDAEGFSDRDGRPKYDKGLGNFEPRMIALQKKYARDLLSHVNPYTKTTYANESAVAFVEISNEDALLTEWSRRHLEELAEPYATTYRTTFNDWLRKKYRDTEHLALAWNRGHRSAGPELLTNGDFTQPLPTTWYFQRDDQTDADFTVQPNGPGNAKYLEIKVRQRGREAWIPQLSCRPFAVKQGEQYAVTFSARCDAARTLGVNCMMAHEPWNRLGLSSSVKVGGDWTKHRLTFVAKEDDDQARITFTSLGPGTYCLSDVSVHAAAIRGLDVDERLEDNTVCVLNRDELDCTPTRRNDFVDFLWDTEHTYWLGMYRFLKKDLGVRSLVSGTQLSYGPAHIQAELDYIDAHSYWMHPRFPNRPWDRRDWYVHNAAMVNDPPGTFASLAGRRVAGMAYTVSEYNHPRPIQYAAEGFPMIAAFGAFQRWDGIFSFAYAHNSDFEPTRLSSYFDIKADPSRLAHMPACAAMFLRGDVAPAKTLVSVPFRAEAGRQQLRETLDPWKMNVVELGLARPWVLKNAIAMDLRPNWVGEPDEFFPPPANFTHIESDTSEMRWDVTKKGAGYFIADTPRTKLFTGFVHGRTFDLGGGIELAVGETALDWATVSLTVMEGDGFDKPGRILIAATGLIKNTDEQLEQLGDDRITLRDRWGSAPVLCEGIRAAIRLPVDPNRIEFFPLDEQGNRRGSVAVTGENEKTIVRLGPEHKTIWYELVVD